MAVEKIEVGKYYRCKDDKDNPYYCAAGIEQGFTTDTIVKAIVEFAGAERGHCAKFTWVSGPVSRKTEEEHGEDGCLELWFDELLEEVPGPEVEDKPAVDPDTLALLDQIDERIKYHEDVLVKMRKLRKDKWIMNQESIEETLRVLKNIVGEE